MATFRKYVGWMIGMIAAVGIVGGAGYLGYQRSQHLAAAAVPPPPTVAVTRGLVVLSVTAPGNVVDTGIVTIVSSVAGQVTQLDLQPGQAISQGQVLARLGDRASFESAV